MHSVAYSVYPSLFTHAGYSPGKDLAAIAMAGVSPNILFAHPDEKAQNLKELATLAKQEKPSYASSGNGTTTHLGAELLFRNVLKVDVQHVPFQSAAAANAVVSGQVPIGSTSMPPVVQLAKAGKVRPIAVTSQKRSPAMPDVPTVSELGYKCFQANTWSQRRRQVGQGGERDWRQGGLTWRAESAIVRPVHQQAKESL